MNFVITLFIDILLFISMIRDIILGYYIFGIIYFIEVVFYTIYIIPIAIENDKKELKRKDNDLWKI